MQVCQELGIPVIADEVFAGLWRLGTQSAMAALQLKPDVACFAKLLTGGTVPMSVTLASSEVFAAFEGDTKAQALLHGHSYTAHPIGCQVRSAASFFHHNLCPTTVPCCLWPVGTGAASVKEQPCAGGRGGTAAARQPTVQRKHASRWVPATTVERGSRDAPLAPACRLPCHLPRLRACCRALRA